MGKKKPKPLLFFLRKFKSPHVSLVMPAALILLVLGIYPTIHCFYMSLHAYNLARRWEMPFVGLRNYTDLFKNEIFATSIGITLAFTIIAVAIEFGLGLAIALFLNRTTPGVGVIVVALSFPVLFPAALSSVMFKYMLSPLGGVLYYGFTTVFGLSQQQAAILANPQGAFIGLLINDMWQWIPFVALVLLYALFSVPPELEEAAKVDGASSFQIFRHVNLPTIRPFILVIILLRTMDSFKVFDIVFPLTYGGPGLATTTLSFFIYLKAFAFLDIGSAAASAVIMLLIITILAQLYIRIVYRGEKI